MKGIRFKLWIGMMFLIGIVLLLIWLFQIVFLDEFYLKMQGDKLLEKGEELVNKLNENNLNNLSIEANLALYDDLESFAYLNQVMIEITDREGNILYKISSGEQQSQNLFRKALNEATSQVLQGNRVQTTMLHPRFGNTFLIIGLPIGDEAIFIMNAPLAPVDETSDILFKQLGYISLILIIIGSGLSFVFARHFTEPIKDIGKVANQIAKGQYVPKIQIKRNDEIGQLAKDLNNMAEELIKTEKLRKEWIGNVSHELRTPLSLIRGYAETIRDVSGDKPEKRNQHLSYIIEASQRLSHLVEDIMSLSKLDAGVVNMNKTLTDIVETAQSVIKGFEDLANKRGIQLRMNSQYHYIVFADKERMEQVLYNIVGNAFKFTNDGGVIEIYFEEKHGVIRVTISDNGQGMEQKVAERIWERYYQGEQEVGGAVIGTGLGLAIVKSILEAHDFAYGVESQVGKGTKIWIDLPVDNKNEH